MKCAICGIILKRGDTRSYFTVYKGDQISRKLWGCGVCAPSDWSFDGPLDRLVDALPIDKNGFPLDVGHCELEALKLATDKLRLKKRLRAARSVLRADLRRRFGSGCFDFEKRRLVGAEGLVLQWKTRAMPDKPVAHLNQQTTVGIVTLENN